MLVKFDYIFFEIPNGIRLFNLGVNEYSDINIYLEEWKREELRMVHYQGIVIDDLESLNNYYSYIIFSHLDVS